MTIAREPLLIVNADDLGWNRVATDRALSCFRDGLVTSATAMVDMADSERAAELGLELDVPVGLHLNLTDPFDGAGIPSARRERQLRACRHFGGRRLRMRSWSVAPGARRLVADAVGDQLERFQELFGREPTHVDGHNHVHACPDVALSPALPRGMKVRDGLWAWPSDDSPMGRLRALRRALTARRFVTTRYFFDIAGFDRAFAAAADRARLARARSAPVEVMAHPGFEHEHERLRSAGWAELLGQLPLGSYRELR